MASRDWLSEPFETVEKFAGFEHKKLGEIICLDDFRVLTLPNGVEIKFEQIIALAGDFYGIPKHPIIDPLKGEDEDPHRHRRFRKAYSTLARAPKDELQSELDKLLAMLEKESEEGRSIDAKKWDKITGGKWFFGIPFKWGRMLHLAENNHDHFLPYAKDAYLTGHKLAINKAREAGEYYGDNADKRKGLLHEAFSMDAFACHFLTDSFTSGHIRTPRVELGKETALEKDGQLLCKYMHDEDNRYGLRVTNNRGDKWIAYGDGFLLEEESRDNLKIAAEAVQNSVDQVYEAYRNPTKELNPAVVTDLIPFIDQEERNNSPLFQVKHGKLHRRSNINDLQDTETVTDWWGPTTLAVIAGYKPTNSAIEHFF